MKNIIQRKSWFVGTIGMLVIASTQMVSHYIAFNDVLKGLSMGVGIGLMIAALKFGHRRRSHS